MPHGRSRLTYIQQFWFSSPAAKYFKQTSCEGFSYGYHYSPSFSCISLLQIYYTLDGSIPTENSTVYDGPIYIDETRVIRAAAVNSICPPEAVVTKSYLFDEISNLLILQNLLSPWKLKRTLR